MRSHSHMTFGVYLSKWLTNNNFINFMCVSPKGCYNPQKNNYIYTVKRIKCTGLWSKVIDLIEFHGISLTEVFEAKIIELINEWNQLNGFMDNCKVIYWQRIKLQFLTEFRKKIFRKAFSYNPGNSTAIID